MAFTAAANKSFEVSIASKPFIFVIGKDKKEYHVHKELIGQLSPALNTLVNGHMKEAQEGRIVWPDLDTYTFVQFVKYAYTGDYTEAEPELSPMKPATGELGPASVLGAKTTVELRGAINSECQTSLIFRDNVSKLGFPEVKSAMASANAPFSLFDYMNAFKTSTTDPGYRSNIKFEAIRQFAQLDTPSMPPEPPSIFNSTLPNGTNSNVTIKFKIPQILALSSPANLWSPRTTFDPHKSHERLLLSHARLYILADKYGVRNLRSLTLYRLHRTLLRVVLSVSLVPDLVALAFEVYDNTSEGDEARAVVSAFFGCAIENVKESAEFRALVKEVGDFAHDLVLQMARRLG